MSQKYTELCKASLDDAITFIQTATNEEIKFRLRMAAWFKVVVFSMLAVASSQLKDLKEDDEKEPEATEPVKGGTHGGSTYL